MRASNDAVADLVPVDVVINATLAAAWYSGSQAFNRLERPIKHLIVSFVTYILWYFLSKIELICTELFPPITGLETSWFTTAQPVGSTRFTGGKSVCL